MRKRTWVFLTAALAACAPAARAASVTIDWDANIEGDLAGYRLFYANASLLAMTTGQAMTDGSVTKMNFPGTGTTAFINNLNDGATYYFRLTAYNSAGQQSEFSVSPLEISTFTPLGVPVAPGNLTSTPVSASRIDLAWTHGGATGFRVERSLNSNFSSIQAAADLPGSARSYTATPLNAGTLYFFRVRASNAMGNSSYSTRSATTLGSGGPGNPGGSSVIPVIERMLTPGLKDGINDTVDFGDAAEVQVVDAGGREYYQSPANGYTHVWSGKDSGGAAAPTGLYIARVKSRDGSVKFHKIILVK